MNEIGIVDLIFLSEKIRQRRANEYLMRIHIISYPNYKQDEQKKFYESILQQIDEDYEDPDQIDTGSRIEVLKSMMAGGSGFQVK